MPLFSPDAIRAETHDGGPCGPARQLLLSDTGGLTQFGAFIEILPPGARSALKHWHSDEDELVHVLEGEVVLHEGGRKSPMRAGDTATFRAGDPVGHCLENAGTQDARYLVIGTRSRHDTVTYPDEDRVQTVDRETGTRCWTDGAGRPAGNPYRPE